ncbi:MAG: hypothetical protein PHI55_01290 [Burkholderiaceae bacterium]|nr:hypothetical protein [Burkholderiaceae bacterium]
MWAGRDGWCALALVIDCYSRELLGWHLSRSGRSKTAEAALEQALIARYGCLGKVKQPLLLRSETAWCSPATATRHGSRATGCSRSSSPHIARSKTAWLSG